MMQVPASLIERIRARKAVLVAGSGFGELAGLPGWRALLDRLLERVEAPPAREALGRIAEQGRVLDALSWLRAHLPAPVVAGVLRDAFPSGLPVPVAFATLLALPWRGIVATTLDDLWQRAVPPGAEPAPEVVQPADAAALATRRGPFLLSLLGSASEPETACLSPGDVRRALGETGAAAALGELFRERSFVFVGVRSTDPDLQILALALGAAPTRAEHFLLAAEAEPLEAEVAAAKLGLVVVPGADSVGDVVAALAEAWTAAAPEAGPGPDDREAWLELWSRDPEDAEATQALARIEARLRADGSWDALLELLLGKVEHIASAADQVATLGEVARIYEEHQGASDRAFAALSTALHLEPSRIALTDELARLAGKAGLWHELATEYSEVIGELSEPAIASRLGVELGRIYAEKLGRDDLAISALQHALVIDARSRAAQDALAPLLERAGRWAELASVLAAAADLAATEPSDRARELALRLRLAEVQEAQLRDADAAIAGYERALVVDAAAPAALEALHRLYRGAERWADLARVLDLKAAAAGAEEAARLRRERAELLGERMGDVEASIAALEAIVASDQTDRAALRALQALYEKHDREEDYLRTVERLCDAAESDTARLPLLRQLAAEWEVRSGGLERAAEALERILQIDPRDADAFRALARVYREAKQPQRLADATVRQIDASDTPLARRELYASLGRLYEEELQDRARALDAYASAEALGDERDATLEALARLYEQQERWRPAVDALEKWARVAESPIARAEANVHAARLLAEKLDDRTGAEQRLATALEVAPDHLDALGALASLYRTQGDHLRAAKLLGELGDKTQNRIDKARLFFEAGALCQDRLDDQTRAVELFARALAVDPEHVAAGERLAVLYERREDWAALDSVLEMLARKAAAGARQAAGAGDEDAAASSRAAADMYRRLGDVQRRLENDDKAAKSYAAAYELDPEAPELLSAYAALRVARGEWNEAARLLRQLLGHGEALGKPRLGEVYRTLGLCEAKTGDQEAAADWYEKAITLDPGDRASVAAMAELRQSEGDFAAVVAAKRALLERAQDDDERAGLQEEIGDICANQLESREEAIAAYEAARTLRPDRRSVWTKLLDLYTAGKQWRAAADALVKLAELETAPEVRAKYAYAAGAIWRDELGEPERALALFERALDDACDMTKAFDAVERLLTDAKDGKQLAGAYRRMIERLPPDGLPELRLRLWDRLADVSLRELGDRETAMTALEVATTLDPDEPSRHEALADLYTEAGPDHLDKAVHEHHVLIAKNPDRLSSYRALADLYGRMGERGRDRLWCVAATLSFLRKADPERQRFFEENRPAEFRPARRKFTDELWSKVVHPDEDRGVAALFILLGHVLAAMRAQQHHDVGLRRRERIDLTRDERIAARALRFAAQTLDLPAPDLFFSDSELQALAVYNLQERGVLTPAFVIGRGAAETMSEPEVIFDVGKRMAYLRPERFMRYAVPTEAGLDVALRATLTVAGSSIGPGRHDGEVERLAADLRRLVTRPVLDQLAPVGRALVEAHGEVIDLQAWMAAADLTATRVGFVLTNELPVAARVISREPSSVSPMSAKQRLKDLLAYSVSEEYFAVRKFLGVEID